MQGYKITSILEMGTSLRNASSQSLPARLCRLARPRTGRKNDMAYFTMLLRYIHQNPLKAGIVEKVKDYEYSSGEYQGMVDPAFQVCDTRTVLNRIPLNDLEAWVNDPLPDDYNFLDNENERLRLRLSDDQVWQEIIKLAGVTCSSDFQKLERQLQRETLGQLRELGASVRQLERLTGISRGIIQFVRT